MSLSGKILPNIGTAEQSLKLYFLLVISAVWRLQMVMRMMRPSPTLRSRTTCWSFLMKESGYKDREVQKTRMKCTKMMQ